MRRILTLICLFAALIPSAASAGHRSYVSATSFDSGCAQQGSWRMCFTASRRAFAFFDGALPPADQEMISSLWVEQRVGTAWQKVAYSGTPSTTVVVDPASSVVIARGVAGTCSIELTMRGVPNDPAGTITPFHDVDPQYGVVNAQADRASTQAAVADGRTCDRPDLLTSANGTMSFSESIALLKP